MVDNCVAIEYQPSWGFKREPARATNLRIDYCNGMKFDDNFDWNNAWYDAVHVSLNTIILIGPPLYSAQTWIKDNVIFLDPDNNILPMTFINLDRVSYTNLSVSKAVDYITMVHNTEAVVIPVNKNDGDFNNKKVMVTLQKDNPIEWIQQWVSYHNKVHGIEGFLIYDNSSTTYSSNDIQSALQHIPATIEIVNWPYPYGPQGSDHAPWDSDYGQYVMLEHAKIRYLSYSSLVLNNDIDELIVIDGLTLDNIEKHLMSTQSGCLRYIGKWIEPYDSINKVSADQIKLPDRLFRNFYSIDPTNTRPIGHKWMLVPSRHLNNQWLVHHITDVMLESSQVRYAHVLAMNTNWSWTRDVFKGDIKNLVTDQTLLTSLMKTDK